MIQQKEAKNDVYQKTYKKGELGQTYRFMPKEDRTAKSYERYAQTAMSRKVITL